MVNDPLSITDIPQRGQHHLPRWRLGEAIWSSHDDPRVVSKISNLLAVLALNHKYSAPSSAYLHGGPMMGIVG